MLFHQPRNIRTLTSPTRTGLRFFSFCYTGSSCSQNSTQVFHCMMVAAWCIIFPRKSITRPQNNHVGALCQHVYRSRTVKFALKSGICRLSPCFVFAWKVAFKLRIISNNSFHLYLAIVEDAHYFCPAFEQRRDKKSQYKHYNH